jgi:hypothetical protein
MKFDLRPYDGAGSVHFGMSRAEAHEKLGSPERSWSMRSGNTADSWPDFVIRYDKSSQELVELEFTDTATVEYDGIDLFRDPDAFSKLVNLDGAALKGTGTIILLKLGISMGENLRDPSSSDRTVCLFCRGRWDNAMNRLTPYQLGQ